MLIYPNEADTFNMILDRMNRKLVLREKYDDYKEFETALTTLMIDIEDEFNNFILDYVNGVELRSYGKNPNLTAQKLFKYQLEHGTGKIAEAISKIRDLPVEYEFYYTSGLRRRKPKVDEDSNK